MKVIKKNQLVILVIALMLVTAGYLNYISNGNAIQTGSNMTDIDQYAAIGDATLVNSGEIIEDDDKQSIMNAISQANVGKNEEENKGNVEETNSKPVEDYFVNSKLEREKMYSQMLETYQKLLESNSISQEQKAISEQEITKINQTRNAIMIAENLISTKGFKNSVVFVNDISVSVVVDADELQPEQIAQIQNIIERELNVDISNIHISNR